MIKILKIDEQVFFNIEEEQNIDEETISIVPDNLDKFKKVAVDTINWATGQEIKKAVDNNAIHLSTSNSKAIILIAKLINSFNPDTKILSPLEKDNFLKMIELAQSGYSDSNLLKSALEAVDVYVKKGVEKATKIMTSTSKNEIIEVLNQE